MGMVSNLLLSFRHLPRSPVSFTVVWVLFNNSVHLNMLLKESVNTKNGLLVTVSLHEDDDQPD